MKMATNALGFLLLTFMPAAGFCDVPLPWSGESSSALTMHIVDASEYEDITKAPVYFYVETRISHSKTGIKRIYFSVNSFAGKDKPSSACSPSGRTETEIIHLDKQAIKVFAWCKKYSDSDTYYIQYTPATDAGDEYVINLFKHKSGNISAVFPNIKTELSSDNFMKVWDDFGGDAL